MIKEILVPVNGGNGGGPQLAAALALAKDVSAHVDALLVQIDPRERLLFLGEGIAATLQGELLDTFESQASKEEEAARSSFLALCRQMQVSVESPGQPAGACSASWRKFHGHIENVLPHEGRLSDLIVISAADIAGSGVWRSAFAATLFGSARPLLLLPPAPPPRIGSTAVIAWDGGMQAARAVGAALPLLARASSVAILAIDADNMPIWAKPERLKAYLARHGVSVQISLTRSDTANVGEILLSKAQDMRADLLVMGGYGHGRLREWALGGATRHVVGHPVLPVLIAN